MTSAAGRPPAAVWAALGTVYVVWGSTYLGIMVAIETLPPLLMSAARFAIAGALLYAIAIRRGDRAGDRPTARHWRSAFVIAALLLLVGNGGVALAEQRIDSGVAALLVATIPLWLVLLDRLVFGRRLAPIGIVGIVAGLAGVVLLVGPAGGGRIDILGAVICLIAPLGWASGSLYARGAAVPERPLVGVGMQMLAGAVLLTVAGVASGELGEVDLGAVSFASIAALIYLVLIGSIVTYSAYIWLLRNASTSLVATYPYVNPVVAVALGAVFLGEAVTPRMLVAGVAIVVSVALIVTAQSASTRVRGRRAERPEPGVEPARRMLPATRLAENA